MPDITEAILARLTALENRLNVIAKQGRSEWTGGVVTRTMAQATAMPNASGQMLVASDDTRPDGGNGALWYNDGSNWISVHDVATYALYGIGFLEYTVATLPSPPTIPTGVRPVAFATNGRKSGEGVGAGTGVPIYWNSETNQWLLFEDNSVVLA